jgi:hypothetical protein
LAAVILVDSVMSGGGSGMTAGDGVVPYDRCGAAVPVGHALLEADGITDGREDV